jgi:23S rRNA pseudouridine1911/1915/1917 synthase
MQKLRTTEQDIDKRLDVYVHEKLPELSRSFVEKLIEQGRVLVNGEREKPGHRLKLGDRVLVEFDTSELTHIPAMQLPILYEDEDCLVIDKPVGVLTHSKGAFNPEATVATFIAPKLEKLEGERAGIVHRLDRATSGVIICAKNPEALKHLQKQFSQRRTKKQYLAIVEGPIEPAEAIIDMPIARNPHKPKTFHVSSSGKHAKTHYKVLKYKNGLSLVELKPETGRTHQLRVHLSHLRHPIIGDELYAGKQNSRLMLHAHKLELTLPNKQRREFVAKIPQEFHTMMND